MYGCEDAVHDAVLHPDKLQLDIFRYGKTFSCVHHLDGVVNPEDLL
jgi:hypothetical protein